MHKSDITYVSKDEIIKMAENMLNEKRRLVIMNGYVDKEGNNVIAYNFDIDGNLKTFICKGEKVLPTITHIYKGSAQWCEEDICEVMDIEFDGLNKGDRLFLPDDFDGSGQILVTPMEELRKKYKVKNEG
ncbi:Ni,Fe-hydrogenase III component G [Clostridium tetanomorphum]|uniref:NADH:ubiquinone oxidoreductase 30kDa subunit domain-containing protein n=1 Tax=Clostridium tetanomorphum TaxID=1553 RepID=A0A923J0V8_CLOTT|nr:NADH-quinone oxidoreductase subunit C [Clostridium tetanomorphum]KAJ53360.1 NADH dehydrogenase (ubiquinone) [Clostridium tetanomorphum DSM 665]MBC2396653.1 hypothetical protein [Clostridium tetanomorphum]MBP1863984.1 Ni,Fe-hydrogenase III component G [Clostridium tetanomorphum]NRS85062.1 Ni,Fe-hydrogenase III component G [Clostridium tetanomorphum]NRZ98279.1 Ni,Fe-hydrogenase III component G [Clostridium tetanomorphum]